MKIIRLPLALPRWSSNLPGSFLRKRAVPLLPYLVLLRTGFAMPSPLTRDAVRSYRTVSPLPPHLAMRVGGLFSVALSVASPRLDVIQPAARRSSDFPPPCDGDPPIRSTRPRITGNGAPDILDILSAKLLLF